jgi:predicted  nucleic acid-binding Zn-ribbon protein
MTHCVITKTDENLIIMLIKSEIKELDSKISRERIADKITDSREHLGNFEELKKEICLLNQTNGDLVEQISSMQDNISNQNITITEMMNQYEELSANVSALKFEIEDEPLIQELSLNVSIMQSNIITIFTSLHNFSLDQSNQNDQLMEIKANIIDLQSKIKVKFNPTVENTNNLTKNFDGEKTKFTNHLAQEMVELDALKNLSETTKIQITNIKNYYKHAVDNITNMKSFTWNLMTHIFDTEKKLFLSKISDSDQVNQLQSDVQHLKTVFKISLIVSVVVLVLLLGILIITVSCFLAQGNEKEIDDVSLENFKKIANVRNLMISNPVYDVTSKKMSL